MLSSGPEGKGRFNFPLNSVVAGFLDISISELSFKIRVFF